MSEGYVIDKKQFNKETRRIAYPIAFQSLMLASVAAADAFMLGRIAQSEMTAVSLASQVQFIFNMFVFSVSSASSILGAQYWGKGDKHTVEDLFNLCIRYSAIISVVFFLACEFVPGALMNIFTADPELIEIGSSYLRIAGWSYMLSGISQCYQAIMKVSDHVNACVLTSTTAVLTNILFNSILIFGLLGLPPMQAKGAALATTLARIIELALCIFLSVKKDYIRPAVSRFFKVPKQLVKDFFRQCLPLLGGGLCWGVGFTAYTAIIGHMGSDAAAANSIAAVVRDLLCCACTGIATAAAIMVGNELGAGRLEKGKAYGIRFKNISYILGFISMGMVLAITPFIVRSVLLTDEAREYLTGMMVIMAVYMIGRCVNTVTINGVLDGGGDTIFDLYSLVVSMWMISIPLAALGAFVFHWPVLAVYACTCLDEIGKIPWVMIRFRKYKWVKDLTRDKAELGHDVEDN